VISLYIYINTNIIYGLNIIFKPYIINENTIIETPNDAI
jgi:hypothetical protein